MNDLSTENVTGYWILDVRRSILDAGDKAEGERMRGWESRKQMRRAKPFISRPLRSSPQRAQRSLILLSCLIVREIGTIRHGTSH